MSSNMNKLLSLLLLPLLSVTTHAQSSRIQDLVTKLRSAPGQQSHSPSYISQRKFEVIGSGGLPLQSTGPSVSEQKIKKEISTSSLVSGFGDVDQAISNVKVYI